MRMRIWMSREVRWDWMEWHHANNSWNVPQVQLSDSGCWKIQTFPIKILQQTAARKKQKMPKKLFLPRKVSKKTREVHISLVKTIYESLKIGSGGRSPKSCWLSPFWNNFTVHQPGTSVSWDGWLVSGNCRRYSCTTQDQALNSLAIFTRSHELSSTKASRRSQSQRDPPPPCKLVLEREKRYFAKCSEEVNEI